MTITMNTGSGSNRSLTGISAALLAGMLSMMMVSCSENRGAEQKAPPPIPVSAYEVKEGNATYYDDYPATVTPVNEIEIRAEVSGYITDIYFKDGQHITKGMKLYAVDQQQYKAAFDQATANLMVAKSNLAKARQDADRYKDLAKRDAVARQTLDHSQADLEAAKMQVEAAEASVKNVQTNLRYSVITAPFDGTIGISLVKLGSSVTAGQTLLNTLSSDDPMSVDCSVDEKQIGRFAQLLQDGEKGDDSTFSILLPDQSIYPVPGKLKVMDRAVDPQTGTIRIRVFFPNAHNVLRAGLTCDLRVRASSSSRSLLIPYKAVVEQMGEYFVYVVSGGKVSQRRVTLGMRINDMVIVKDGLRLADQIVTEGVQKLRDNAPVMLATSAPATQGK
ncbi:MAG TPA: efflux RND transporter periplasmic adaptor subunit [Bacteroidota bacterium]|nr:efflux RND transporter periplasmic adaptor subunit [Bacteroidota bacterium]